MGEAEKKVLELLTDLEGPVSTAAAELNRTVRKFPSGMDFHFYANFGAFSDQVQRIRQRAAAICGPFSSDAFPEASEDALAWLVNAHDERLERVDSALDAARGAKKGAFLNPEPLAEGAGEASERKSYGRSSENQSRKAVPFHVPSIPRPQDVHGWATDNSNIQSVPRKPYVEDSSGDLSVVGNEKQEDKNGPPEKEHPLQELISGFKYQVGQLEVPSQIEPPLSLGEARFHYVDSLAELKAVSLKLRSVSEFAVDLEYHSYRSFRGFVSLIQISTREEDFVIDPFPLRKFLGPLLGPVFSNPCILKVMHGADRDIVWLQQDFGIYVANLFDTGQAARVLELESFGLAFLLNQFCGIIADKRYQLADWRIRPLSQEMLKYAREDTRYLLHIYDNLKVKLFQLASGDNSAILQVLDKSRQICLQLYEHETFSEDSYKRLLLNSRKYFSDKATAIVQELYGWRDSVAREKDESTGYVLSNSLLLRLADKPPENIQALRSILRASSPLAQKMAPQILQIILEARPAPQPRQVAQDHSSQVKDPVRLEKSTEILVPVHEEPAVKDAEGSEKLPEDQPAVKRRRTIIAGTKKASPLFGGAEVKASRKVPKVLGGTSLLGSLLEKPKLQYASLAEDLAAAFRLPFAKPNAFDETEKNEVAQFMEKNADQPETVVPESENVPESNNDFLGFENREESLIENEEISPNQPSEKEAVPISEKKNFLFPEKELPLSLREKERLSHGGNKNKNRDTTKSLSETKTKKKERDVLKLTDKKTIDFEAKKKQINLEYPDGGGGGGASKRKVLGKAEKAKVNRLGFEMDLEGLKAGKRSQVFPRSGNRSFTLAKKK